MTEDGEEFDAAYWEDRYRRGEGAGKLDPSPSLVTETSALLPGTALDAGCGSGGDSLWLAARGWQVTAVDISATALQRARLTAEAAGPDFAARIDWVQGDLTEWDPDERTFDLVTSHYVHVPGPPETLFRRLGSWVAPGGTLLVVGHGDHQGHGHGHPDAARVRTEQIVSSLPVDEWSIVAAEPRTHTVQRPDGGSSVTLDDVVVHARRHAPQGRSRKTLSDNA